MPSTCDHPQSERVRVQLASEFFFKDEICWCPLCGAIYTRKLNEAGRWREPACATLPGWTCACGAFCGSAKDLLAECRACGAPRMIRSG